MRAGHVRMLRMALLAGLVAIALILLAGPVKGEECEGDPDDPNDTCFAVYWPGMCAYMDPDSYWYRHWCSEMEAEGLVAEEIVEHERIGDVMRVRIWRKFTDRPDEYIERFVPMRRQR